jgi:hypothetical protein
LNTFLLDRFLAVILIIAWRVEVLPDIMVNFVPVGFELLFVHGRHLKVEDFLTSLERHNSRSLGFLYMAGVFVAELG